MAAFSPKCSRSLLHPALLPNYRIRSIPQSLSNFGDFKDSFFSCYSSDPHLNNVELDVTVFGESNLENDDRMISSGNRDPSVIEKWNADSPSVVIEPRSCAKVTLEKAEMDKRTKNDQFKDVKTQGKDKKRKKKHGEENPTAYVHVRARRGQATDSHSLAERARREKINKKMKQLQALVPGCDKINSKSLLLDAIIDYVHSLQNQVGSPSINQLASVNPMPYGFGGDLDDFMVSFGGESGDLADFMKSGSLAFCPTQPTVLPEDATTLISTASNCPILEGSSVCESLQQGFGPFGFWQEDDYENLLRDAEELKQITQINNPSCF